LEIELFKESDENYPKPAQAKQIDELVFNVEYCRLNSSFKLDFDRIYKWSECSTLATQIYTM
jgi:hypothetical protein